MSTTIVKYQAEHQKLWNDFIEHSKNGTFMLNRGYMNYHSDRFIDHSLMFFDNKEQLVAVMPASLHGDELVSHGGLTYGGIVSSNRMSVKSMLDLFSDLKKYLKKNALTKLIYKRVPSIYHKYFADEDLYALFINEAKLIRRDVSFAICIENRIAFSKGKKCGISKAKQSNVQISIFNDFSLFFDCENKLLMEKYNTQAAHSADEMALLYSRFPDNIKMFGAFMENELVAGTILFVTESVIHTQYIATTEKGRKTGAFDLLVDYLLTAYNGKKKILDFGISTEQEGLYLNEGLSRQKEMFGARAVVYDFYELVF